MKILFFISIDSISNHVKLGSVAPHVEEETEVIITGVISKDLAALYRAILAPGFDPVKHTAIVSPLLIPEGAKVIDSTNLSIDEVVNKIMDLI